MAGSLDGLRRLLTVPQSPLPADGLLAGGDVPHHGTLAVCATAPVLALDQEPVAQGIALQGVSTAAEGTDRLPGRQPGVQRMGLVGGFGLNGASPQAAP